MQYTSLDEKLHIILYCMQLNTAHNVFRVAIENNKLFENNGQLLKEYWVHDQYLNIKENNR